ncbi:hypothetical protein [Thioalkalivibrio sp. ALJ8]|uniref:hypothetical protein n=1 Tax=Thioalkalivibrio sp. ALJ8 TaxID=1158757 RepID=UPI0003763A4B|nr:hypothetical protein [Thioalkalivibrio sp. ALJ8]
MTEQRTLTRAAFARELGVNKSTVTRLAQAGRLVLDGRGRVVVAASIQRIQATAGGRTDVAARHAEERGRAILGATAPATPAATAAEESPELDSEGEGAAAPAGGEPLDPESGQPMRTVYKARALAAENARTRVELDLQAGRRYARETVEREAHHIGQTLRASLERMSDVLAPQLATLDPSQRRAVLDSEAAAQRRILKRELARSQRRIRKEADHG